MKKSYEFGVLKRFLLLLAEEEEATIPKQKRRILVRQHFEMRPVLVEFNTTFQNLINYFSHPLSLKTWKLSDMHVIIYHQYIEDIYFFEVNTKYISSSELKTSKFSRLRSTSENLDVFKSRDEIYLVFTDKK